MADITGWVTTQFALEQTFWHVVNDRPQKKESWTDLLVQRFFFSGFLNLDDN